MGIRGNWEIELGEISQDESIESIDIGLSHEILDAGGGQQGSVLVGDGSVLGEDVIEVLENWMMRSDSGRDIRVGVVCSWILGKSEPPTIPMV